MDFGEEHSSFGILFNLFIRKFGDFSGSPVVKNPPPNAGVVSSIPGGGTKISHATRQLSLCDTNREKLDRSNEESGHCN